MSDLGREAREFLRTHRNGVLSTLSKRFEGHPFGSVTPFVLDQQGRPVILISTLAEHTRNLQADGRTSLIAHPCVADVQAAGRVTVVGEARQIEDKGEIAARYLRHFPQAEQYFDMHDFQFYRIEPDHIRYIGGFGKIHWISAQNFLAPESMLHAQENDILAHMNADHRHNLTEYCRHCHGVSPESVEMIGIDPDGFDVRADAQILRFAFSEPVLDAPGARKALVALAQECRNG